MRRILIRMWKLESGFACYILALQIVAEGGFNADSSMK